MLLEPSRSRTLLCRTHCHEVGNGQFQNMKVSQQFVIPRG